MISKEVKHLIEDNADLLDADNLTGLFLVAANRFSNPAHMVELIVLLETADIKSYSARIEALETSLKTLFATLGMSLEGQGPYDLETLVLGSLPSSFAIHRQDIIRHVISHKENYKKWIVIEDCDEPDKFQVRFK